MLVVGGAPEALNSEKDKVTLVLKRRKGFIKLALRFGVDLVPTFTFGEAFIYDSVPNPAGSLVRKVQDALQHVVGFAPVLFFGRGVFQYNFGIVPHRKPLTLVVGAPIRVDKVINPSEEQVDQLHEQYVTKLKELYERYNKIYGDTSVQLVIN